MGGFLSVCLKQTLKKRAFRGFIPAPCAGTGLPLQSLPQLCSFPRRLKNSAYKIPLPVFKETSSVSQAFSIRK